MLICIYNSIVRSAILTSILTKRNAPRSKRTAYSLLVSLLMHFPEHPLIHDYVKKREKSNRNEDRQRIPLTCSLWTCCFSAIIEDLYWASITAWLKTNMRKPKVKLSHLNLRKKSNVGRPGKTMRVCNWQSGPRIHTIACATWSIITSGTFSREWNPPEY